MNTSTVTNYATLTYNMASATLRVIANDVIQEFISQVPLLKSDRHMNSFSSVERTC